MRVTLSRPEDRWVKQTKQNAVGCMLGFYILPVDADSNGIKYRPGETFQTDFVPMNQVSTPLGFTMEVLEEDQCYMIVPCTYESKVKGDFSISVASEVDFAFQKNRGRA